MNDWPTFNRTNIQSFIKELKDFFGSPLLIENIDRKKTDFKSGQSVWYNEAGSSIAEMFETSKTYYDETDFDKIVDSIINYYSKL